MLGLVVIIGMSSRCVGGPPVSRLPAETIVADREQPGWNRLVLLATMRIASGDTEKLSPPIRDAVGKLMLAIMADVSFDPDTRRYRLRDVGIGYAVNHDAQVQIVDSSSDDDASGQLGFFHRRVLTENEKRIADVRQVVRTSTLLIFDAPALFFRDQQHQAFVARHLVWVDPATGRVALANWLLKQVGDNGLTAVDEPMRLIAGRTRESRAIHVDGDEFTLGVIPGERAFALESLPPGKDASWNPTLRQLASLRQYDQATLTRLTSAMNAASRNGDSDPVPGK